MTVRIAIRTIERGIRGIAQIALLLLFLNEVAIRGIERGIRGISQMALLFKFEIENGNPRHRKWHPRHSTNGTFIVILK